MKTERIIERLEYLEARVFENRLLLIEAKGNSSNEAPGVPKLVPTNKLGKEHNHYLLELDFINQAIEDVRREEISFELQTVIDLSKLSFELKGVKVNAEKNADIALIDTTNEYKI